METKAQDVIKIPQILLPKVADMTAWAVVACDQFTSDEAYWAALREYIAGRVSTYNLIFPEIYLKDNPEQRIRDINAKMAEYIQGGVFKTVEGGFIQVERTTKESGTRTGLVLAVDLESYSYEKGSLALIRSTEATILDRLPPRIKIRQNALIELPHVMLLYNDKDFTVLNSVKRGQTLYDFTLNMGGGSVRGDYVANAEEVVQAFNSLIEGKQGKERMLFAVGDGNHSLATAKSCWDNIKGSLTEEERAVHPARFALCEAVNIYDKALFFHPIHRFVKTDKAKAFFNGWNITGESKAQIVLDGKKYAVPFPGNVPQGIRQLDEYITDFIAQNGGEVDYIHGEEELCTLTSGGAGVLLPSINKDDFFNLIISGGNLPRKTFSMGEGNEKRYYIEAKMIK